MLKIFRDIIDQIKRDINEKGQVDENDEKYVRKMKESVGKLLEEYDNEIDMIMIDIGNYEDKILESYRIIDNIRKGGESNIMTWLGENIIKKELLKIKDINNELKVKREKLIEKLENYCNLDDETKYLRSIQINERNRK